MNLDASWQDQLRLDLDFGYMNHQTPRAPKQHNPKFVLNDSGSTVLRAIRDELARCESFTMSVAFISPAAIALLKQALLDFEGDGRIVTSDYLGFNSPRAFEELRNIAGARIDVRIHSASGFHPKGYLFQHENTVTAIVGSSNLTSAALLTNHEWNLKVSASPDSDLAEQIRRIVGDQVQNSEALTGQWIADYAKSYVAPRRILRKVGVDQLSESIEPNSMQAAALKAIGDVRRAGEVRAIIVSATGTGKTILSALDVRAVEPRRLLFVVHREQVLDKTISEYKKVLGGEASDYGKLAGASKDLSARYLFATVQSLSRPEVLSQFASDVFDYVIIDEAHRSGSPSHRRVIAHFDPVFMLGMTATPERTDGFNVFELFDYNLAYEIRLNRALEEGMVAPFHYYGVADVEYGDGTTVDAESDLSRLVSPERINYVIQAIETYGQAGILPRGLMFCRSRKEAEELSCALNRSYLRGRLLRTIALTGEDPIEHRESAVTRLESGELDYILSVDVFNEGVDIPSVNQIIMLRQTQSSIVFVQQLGRGLRKFDDKDYLVVIDFIGNYANNFLIPIALFGDDSLNKEALRKRMISAEEAGAVAGLSSVSFDRIAQERVLRSIGETRLDDMSRIKAAVLAMRNRVGGIPRLWDFFRFESVDPVLLATKRIHYPDLIRSVLKIEIEMSGSASKALQLLSAEVLPAKRPHEFLLLRELLRGHRISVARVSELFSAAGILTDEAQVGSAIDTLTLDGYGEADVTRYERGVASRVGESFVALSPEVIDAYREGSRFKVEVDDLVDTGIALVSQNYNRAEMFTVGKQYSRKDALRLLCWPRKWASTIYGYKVDVGTSACPIFVTLHKSVDVSSSTAYEDSLIDPSTMLWYTRSRRSLDSGEVRSIVENNVRIYVFVKKDDAEGSDFYYLGQAVAFDAEQATMQGKGGVLLDVVRMKLRFGKPIETGLYDYFHPVVTAAQR